MFKLFVFQCWILCHMDTLACWLMKIFMWVRLYRNSFNHINHTMLSFRCYTQEGDIVILLFLANSEEFRNSWTTRVSPTIYLMCSHLMQNRNDFLSLLILSEFSHCWYGKIRLFDTSFRRSILHLPHSIVAFIIFSELCVKFSKNCFLSDRQQCNTVNLQFSSFLFFYSHCLIYFPCNP